MEKIRTAESKFDLGRQLLDREVKCLYFIALERAQKGAIIEIGSYKGGSTVYLAQACKVAGTGNKVYAIDPHIHGTEQIFKENINKLGFGDIVIPLVMKSEEAIKQWHQPISLLFIDGDHHYEAVRKDFLLWEPWLVKGGVIAFHDKFDEGPAKVISKHILLSSRYSQVRVVQGLMYATRDRNDNFLNWLNKCYLIMWTCLAIVLFLVSKLRYLRWMRRLIVKAAFGKRGGLLSKKNGAYK